MFQKGDRVRVLASSNDGPRIRLGIGTEWTVEYTETEGGIDELSLILVEDDSPDRWLGWFASNFELVVRKDSWLKRLLRELW